MSDVDTPDAVCEPHCSIPDLSVGTEVPRIFCRSSRVEVGRAERVTSTRAAPPNRWCRKANLVCPLPRPISARLPDTPVWSASRAATPDR